MARILVVGPHPDDAELGMGAAIARFADQGHDVLLLDLTDGEPTPFGDPATRAAEAEAAANILSPQSEPGSRRVRHAVRRVLLGLTNRRLEHTLAARHAVAGVIRAHQAQIVFAPYFEDAHPDHVAATRIVEDARFDAKLTKVEMPVPGGLGAGPPVYPKWLFYYYATHLRIVPSPSFLIDATGYLDRKMEAIGAYRSQFELNPAGRGVPGWVRAQAEYLGSRIGTGAAEGFYSREAVGLSGLGELAG